MGRQGLGIKGVSVQGARVLGIRSAHDKLVLAHGLFAAFQAGLDPDLRMLPCVRILVACVQVNYFPGKGAPLFLLMLCENPEPFDRNTPDP